VTIVLPALVAVSLGISLEWVLLTGSTPQAVVSAFLPRPAATLRPVFVHLAPDFQTGVIFPQWGASAYSDSNTNWLFGLGEITDQTGAGWVEIPITLYQAHFTDTALQPSPQTPTPQSLAAGIGAAHAHGFHVFVVPFLTVGASGWAGDIGRATASLHAGSVVRTATWRAAWFDGYWQALAPYLEEAATAGAEQFALGTEYEYLELDPNALWNTLIARAHTLYSGALTYDMNWTAACAYAQDCAGTVTAHPSLPRWMTNPTLAALGVSEYRPLSTSAQPVEPGALASVWHTRIQADLDRLATLAGKPMLLSEIGYRNNIDALVQPWRWQSTAPPDPQLQAAAYTAALTNAVVDLQITGIYFWGWSVPAFQPNWLPAA
jgi:hypothetical protein